MAWAAVCSKAVVVVDSLFTVAPNYCEGSVFGHCFVIQYLCRSFASILMGEENAGCFTLTVFLVYYDS